MKLYFLKSLLVVICFLMTNQAVKAQVSYGGCFLGNGFQVPTITDNRVNDIAIAKIESGIGPVIIYNPNVGIQSTDQTRLFFYFHECAHHILGHTLGLVHPLLTEQQADCWAIRELVSRRIFSRYDMNVVQRDLANFAPGDWSHLPGTQRAVNFLRCLANK